MTAAAAPAADEAAPAADSEAPADGKPTCWSMLTALSLLSPDMIVSH